MDAGVGGRYGSISVRREAGETVLVLAGEIDAAVVTAFDEEQGSDPVPVDAIDAGEVTFIASVGVALLLRWVEAGPPGGPVLRRSSPRLDRFLELTRLTDVFRRPPEPPAG
ncbi:STAS domain-containing protein [Petropleomorpha daqingensis]|uniref:Anti-anti-sigma regulatory factor n=1 Tax=Petropleomorpha daqingensis TaxID=2026353 RepID=A0A853CLM6_9ACTN|nr:STAS domain-containing protein [Petropleomorpha daqingensis]NYJ08071.1 anti-anti-sigma regulatory factor [Petropleomorpha daqingensis]